MGVCNFRANANEMPFSQSSDGRRADKVISLRRDLIKKESRLSEGKCVLRALFPMTI
jgi:hypothetical protein